jgi:hypothetical protein
MLTINVSYKCDIIQALPLPKAGGDEHVPQHQKAAFDVAKLYTEVIVFTWAPWPITSDEKYSMVDEVWKLASDAHNCERASAGAPVCPPSVYQLPSCLSCEINPQTPEAARGKSVLYSSIRLIMILNPNNINGEI